MSKRFKKAIKDSEVSLRRETTQSSPSESEETPALPLPPAAIPSILVESELIPTRIGGLLLKALNSFDLDCWRDFFRFYGADHSTVIHQVYNSRQHLTVSAINPFGDYTFLHFYSLDLFYDFMENFYLMIPDAVFQVENHRTCYERDTSVYISSFKCMGTVISSSPTLVSIDNDGGMISIVQKSTEPTVREGFRILNMNGSIATYTDNNGCIYCLEFFYEFN